MPDSPADSSSPPRTPTSGTQQHPSGFRVDPAPDGRGRPPQQKPPMVPRSRAFIAFLVGLLAINILISLLTAGPASRPRVPYQPFFVNEVKAGNVKEITSTGESIEGTLKNQATYTPPEGDAVKVDKDFKTEVPTFIDPAQVTALLTDNNVVINAEAPDSGRSTLGTIILGFLPTILLIGFFIWLIRRQMGGGGGGGILGGFGRSTARRVQEDAQNRITFKDVAGIDEAEDELEEIVDFLKNPQRYTKLGARIPHGVLLYGPPGTGKTLLARAVAGEAHAAFFHVSASEFVEAIVGVGASRVRDLFKQAKEAAPAIIFIDELDAIGRSRSGNISGLSGGNDEREQTLNQILTEMDGFEPGTNVIVLGATNRPEILDPALLRPGRFDRRIAVNPPDRPGRVAILKIHTRSVALADDVDLDRIAASIPGSTGADIALLVNEAALFAARRDHTKVEQRDFTDAVEKILLGAERQVVMTDADRKRTAYHESGHALVGMLTPGADPVRKISIIPRGQALGVTLSTPDSDRYNYRREELLAQIKVALGGRGAEEVVFDDLSTGAESDIQNLTQVARGMVGRWGMSDAIGPIAVTDGRQNGPLLPGAMPASEPTQELVDQEVRRIVDESERDVIALLTEHRDQLDALANALLDHETLDQKEAYEVAGVPPVHADPAEEAKATTAAPAASTSAD
ncbi:MAG TPA: ATP-dependent zinc metalloprotease FtsH [Solirubrobacterales bacterium]|nr:ATP-dependent zinc metalloprotease FtsH [Solirubrobacterales bacterium]